MLLYNYYKNILLYNLIYQNRYKNLYNFSRLYKISLKLEIKKSIIEFKKESLINLFFVLFILTNQIPYFFYSKQKKVFNKDKEYVGCKLVLRGKNLYNFLNKLVFYGIFQRNFNGFFISKKFIKNLNFTLKDIENFFEIKEEFLLIRHISNMDINIMTTSKNNKDFIIFMKNFNFKKI